MFRDGKQTAEHACAAWNARWAGQEAFTTDDGQGYRQGSIFDSHYLAHRVLWLLAYGEWPAEQIDHINGDPSDNRIVNLRAVCIAENLKNQKRRGDNTSGVTGVYWSKVTQKWFAQIRISGKLIHLGLFEKFDEAVSARRAAEITYGFHKNHGRAA